MTGPFILKSCPQIVNLLSETGTKKNKNGDNFQVDMMDVAILWLVLERQKKEKSEFYHYFAKNLNIFSIRYILL